MATTATTTTLLSSEHRKIDLQSPADLSYIHAHISRTARDKIDRALPPAAAPQGEEDRLRRRVEELVDAYVEALWSGVRGNVRVNGIDVVKVDGEEGERELDGGEKMDVEDDLEPFDQRLADRIRNLEAQKEALTERVADLRRTAPQLAAQNFEAQFAAESEQMEKEAKAQHNEAMAQAAGTTIQVDVEALQRWDEVQRTWERGTDGLVALKRGLGETRAKAERAKKVVEYVEGKS